MPRGATVGAGGYGYAGLQREPEGFPAGFEHLSRLARYVLRGAEPGTLLGHRRVHRHGGHQVRSLLSHPPDGLPVQETPVLHRVHAGFQGVVDRLDRVGVGRRLAPGLVSLLYRRPHLLDGELGGAWLLGMAVDAARGHELDAGGSGLYLLPRRAAHGVRSVGLASEKPAVTAGHGDGPACGYHSWTGEDPQLHGAADLDRQTVGGADVPDGGDACAQVEGRVLGAAQDG